MSRADKASEALAPRSAARLGAVQALYQMDLAQTQLNDVIGEFLANRVGCKAEDRALADADTQFFQDVLKGVVRRQREIDPLVDQQLAQGWRLTRIDSILRAALRAGVFELLERTDVPARVVINEYIQVAHAFFSDEEPRVVNGVLDKLARRLRAAEFPPPAA
jgi:N utilization substance protein B